MKKLLLISVVLCSFSISACYESHTFWNYDTFTSLFSNQKLPGVLLQRSIREHRHLASNLMLAREKHSENIIEVQYEIKEQFLRWEREQQGIASFRWIKNDVLRNHLTQYRWQYVGGVVAVAAGYYFYKWVNNRKAQQETKK